MKTPNIVLAVATALTLAPPMSTANAAGDPQDFTRDVEAGPIWNQADAERKCPDVADKENGAWTGRWRTTQQNRMSVCEISDRPWQEASRQPVAPREYQDNAQQYGASDPVALEPPPARDAIRDVEAGPIWSQTDAEAKCPIAAYAVRGRWTGQWTTTEQGRMSVCKISGAQLSSSAEPSPISAPPVAEAPLEPPPVAKAPMRTTRNVRAGLMMTQDEAESKCPSVAQSAHGQWTGKWWLPTNGEMAVCEITEGY